jgi:hypothetical protein
MEEINKFLNKIAYKFDKGYPDINNEQDILLLEQELLKININIKINEGLTPAELQKRAPRIPKFIEKLFNDSSFELEDGGTIILDKVNIDGIDFNKNSSQDDLEQALNKAKKIILTGTSGGTTISIPSGKLKKSAEFGGGKGSGGGAANTALAESAQAVVNAIRYNVLGRDLSKEDLTSQNYSKAKSTSDTTNSIEEIESFLNSNPDWMTSSISIANKLASSYPGNFEFYRGSGFVDRINNSAKIALKEAGETGNINKWNPADIWMVNPEVKSTEFPTEINELNSLIKKLFDANKLIGVSLKKTSDAKIDVVNDSPKKQYTYESVSSSDKSKDAYINYSEGKIQFRTFENMSGFQGEIIGTEAKHGKVSLGLINQLLSKVGLSQTKDPNEIRNLAKNPTPEFETEFKNLFEKHVQGDFDNFYKEAGDDKKYSKFLALNLIDIVSSAPKKQKNTFVSLLINYAKSQSDISSVFIKAY